MISLEQIQLLEQKVESAVAKILQLTEERDTLHQRCVQLEEENKRLQSNILDFHQDQERIEQGIINALDKLNAVENSVLQAVALQINNEETNVATPVVQDTFNIHQEDEYHPDFSEKKEQYNEVTISAEQQIVSNSINEINSSSFSTEEDEKKLNYMKK